MKMFYNKPALFLSFVFCFTTVGNHAHAQDVRIIGDSIFSWTGAIESNIENSTEVEILSHAVNGAEIEVIRDQYKKIRENEITTIIMNGGINNIIKTSLQNCRVVNDKCIALLNSNRDVFSDLLETMAADGVENVIYLGYYYMSGFIANGLEDSLDVFVPLMQETCTNADLNCVFVDPRDEFQGVGGLIGFDGIHPTAKGSAILSRLIIQAL